jgi:hypothetical protein
VSDKKTIKMISVFSFWINNYYIINCRVLFRDAVGQAGTGPALITLKNWIQEEKVTGKEAAELVMVLPDAARYPTEEYLEAFFVRANDFCCDLKC